MPVLIYVICPHCGKDFEVEKELDDPIDNYFESDLVGAHVNDLTVEKAEWIMHNLDPEDPEWLKAQSFLNRKAYHNWREKKDGNIQPSAV